MSHQTLMNKIELITSSSLLGVIYYPSSSSVQVSKLEILKPIKFLCPSFPSVYLGTMSFVIFGLSLILYLVYNFSKATVIIS